MLAVKPLTTDATCASDVRMNEVDAIHSHDAEPKILAQSISLCMAMKMGSGSSCPMRCALGFHQNSHILWLHVL